jgi:hypothetical protein
MPTLRQIEANQQNAQRSTGPRTPEGKARVRLNALKHGLAGEHLVIPTEELPAFEAFRDDLLEHLDPADPLEAGICIRLIGALWRAQRCGRLETAGFHMGAPSVQLSPEVPEAVLPIGILERYGHLFSLVSRYEEKHERSFYRALHQLLALRKGSNTKQTQLHPSADPPT